MPTLYLIPTTLASEITNSAILPQQQEKIKHLQHFIVETAKVARAHIKQLKLDTPLQQLDIQELNKHKQDLLQLIAPLKAGHDVGLMSDCGAPAIADPGSKMVTLAHKHGFTIEPLIGPSSIFLALMGSGSNGQSFAFNGYLPAEPKARQIKLGILQDLVLKHGQTQIFIETPFRNQHLLASLLQHLNGEIVLTIAIDLMNPDQQIISKTIKQWNAMSKTLPNLQKHEVVFVLGN